MSEELHGKSHAEESERKMQETLSLLEQADHEAAKFRVYQHDNHWAQKAGKLLRTRLA